MPPSWVEAGDLHVFKEYERINLLANTRIPLVIRGLRRLVERR